ncbi:hypothetical protein AMS68_002901 [Peltaster fructicola]|uniref:GRIP domain-containing protein n=1 Tax=Peltaster fructicola TaxID=286661 RepID=A0A6H0XRM7_9PEZI|nr:hypothetical protein AMS68_002901 [Peltaster fructicola]
MSAVASTEPAKQAGAGNKKRKKSKKKTNGATANGADTAEVNGTKDDAAEDDEEEDTVVETPVSAVPSRVQTEDTLHMPSSPPDPSSPTDLTARLSNGASKVQNSGPEVSDNDTAARLDAMQQERDTLRSEVSQLRQELERLQTEHTEELTTVREELSQTQTEKTAAETQYRKLLDQVNRIKQQLGDRLRADAEELAQARSRIETLESELGAAQEENERMQESTTELEGRLESQGSEIDELRSRGTLSTSNWAKERDEMLSKTAYLQEEYEVAKQAMQDWEILATEERSRREAQEERAQELEDRLETQRQAFERAKTEADTQSNTVDGLQRALRDLQDERKKELRELVEQSQSTAPRRARSQHKEASDHVGILKQELDTTQKELERALPFEKEVKEKNLLIGKLRHEAVILNDHLTKALRFLKRGKPEDNVDRQLVTNHFMQFLALDRSDPKKFEVLQLIAALLGWDEQKKEQAGLLRQGAGVGVLRVPLSPFRRTPSTPSLGDFVPESPSATKESLAELWSDFLAREAESGMSSLASSRRPSVAQSVRSGSYGGLTSPILGRSAPELKRKESGNGQAIKSNQTSWRGQLRPVYV